MYSTDLTWRYIQVIKIINVSVVRLTDITANTNLLLCKGADFPRWRKQNTCALNEVVTVRQVLSEYQY